MRKTIFAASTGAASIAALLVISAMLGIAPAAADATFSARDQIIADFCNGQPQTVECQDWRDNRNLWSNQQYQRFYLDHWTESGFNTTAGAAAFGLTVDLGAPIQNADGPAVTIIPAATMPAMADAPATTVFPADSASDPGWVPGVQRGNVEGNRAEVIGDSNNHVGDCLATFRSYDVGTDSYLAFDGTRHRCKL